ncbi:hemerythrin domain-containing protein [Streptomyces sp. NBC_01754]|uniref:hemerythrin domain-containing protein n=1 Tax=Streptomyces sp. NBC_01754 TaxID=2975930 RepID=UPI002DD9765A|nr:hemerythrin domain-containing protein [Streptomyces sp. NBC_01754]WSC95990.1 hemerythrin domain-containing protein [Streptomyces sp. NBC_01754]
MTRPRTGTPAGRQMVRELLTAHAPLRSDVVALRDGLEMLDAATTRTQDVEELLGGLTVADLTWQLKAGCQHFCAHLDVHHAIEDARMLPVIRRQFPQLTDQIGQLRREHEEVRQMITRIRADARRLNPKDERSVHVVLEQIVALADHLQAHLDFEEQTLFPYFLRMDRDWHTG